MITLRTPDRAIRYCKNIRSFGIGEGPEYARF